MTELYKFITEMTVIAGFVVSFTIVILRIANGMKCQLRSEMLRIYYSNKGAQTIRQYEIENFIFLYEAYKALHGNSFIDKIYKEVMTWKVET